MKYLKLYENFNESDIHEICRKYKIENYTINDDGSIDVNGNVDLQSFELTKLPLKFRNIIGSFNCNGNKLTSLKGCPESVGGNFYCYNNQLTSLEFCPISIIGDYFSCNNNRLTSLEGSPKSVGVNFNCSYNQLTSLEGSPISVGGHFYCYENKLTSLKGSPKSVGGDFNCHNNDIIDFIGFIEPGEFFHCSNNPIYNIWELFRTKEHIELLNDYDCIRGNDIVIDRLNMFLEEIDKPTVRSVDGYNNI